MMLQFNRKLEYALAVLCELHQRPRELLTTAREIAQATGISYDMCTKCLQRLQKPGLVVAIQGKHGGYRLVVDCGALTVEALLRQLGEPVDLVDCLDDSSPGCQRHDHCSIREPITRLNNHIHKALCHVTVKDLFHPDGLATTAPPPRGGGHQGQDDAAVPHITPLRQDVPPARYG